MDRGCIRIFDPLHEGTPQRLVGTMLGLSPNGWMKWSRCRGSRTLQCLLSAHRQTRWGETGAKGTKETESSTKWDGTNWIAPSKEVSS